MNKWKIISRKKLNTIGPYWKRYCCTLSQKRNYFLFIHRVDEPYIQKTNYNFQGAQTSYGAKVLVLEE